MKKIILSAVILTSFTAQSQIQDSVTLGAQYSNESYYSLEDGEVSLVNNSNWDLAFDVSPFGAAIRMNRRTDVLYLYPGTIADWSTLDTTGHSVWTQYIDGYESWSQGALNATANLSDPTDLGWGIYNSITHITNGNRLFVLKLQDNSYRKLIIEQLGSGSYTFKYANINGTNEISETITKSAYNTKNFIYYSLLNETIVDREPASTDWDIVFTNYVLQLAPGYYSGVTGVLSNSTFTATTVAESNNVPVANANMTANNYGSEIDIIGYDWKTFNMGTFTYTMEDSLCYFIKSENDDVWKLTFTGFAGSSNGRIYFTKEKVAFANVAVKEDLSVNVFPVPASDIVTIRSAATTIAQITIYNSAGKIVSSQNYAERNDMIQLPVSDFNNGIYLIQIVTDENQIITKKISIQH